MASSIFFMSAGQWNANAVLAANRVATKSADLRIIVEPPS